MSQPFGVRRLFLLPVPAFLGLAATILLLAALPARTARAATASPAPAGCDSNEAVEPNNTYAQATALSVPAVLYGYYICDIPQPQDEDWYSMTLDAGQQVMIFLHFQH